MPPEPGIAIRRLEGGDDLDGFESGVPELDEYLRCYAMQNQRRRCSVTYLAIEACAVLGYVTIAASQVERAAISEALVRRLPRYALPTLSVCRLASGTRQRGLGVGTRLIRHVLLESVEMAARFGCIGVRLDAKPEAMGFYERFGFVCLQADDRSSAGLQPMFLPLNQIEGGLRG
ncbi:MAG: GNAT family N-acetyltransferase [Coriobacteriia bacterium]|nr:GNAT family N-acetyltransferase [Coriobacteriia bacterium]